MAERRHDAARAARTGKREWGRRASLLAAGLALCAVLLAIAGGRVVLSSAFDTSDPSDAPGSPGSPGSPGTPGGSDAPGAPGDSASVTYALCTGNLAVLQLLPPRRSGEPFAIAAQLDRAATQELERLTQANVGRSLDVVVGDWFFVRGPIRSALRSGLLVNTAFATREEAETWLERLRSDLPEEPCGPEV